MPNASSSSLRGGCFRVKLRHRYNPVPISLGVFKQLHGGWRFDWCRFATALLLFETVTRPRDFIASVTNSSVEASCLRRPMVTSHSALFSTYARVRVHLFVWKHCVAVAQGAVNALTFTVLKFLFSSLPKRNFG